VTGVYNLKILITNDDGIRSEGLIALAREISKIADITVISPDRERSATGHAITMHKPLRVEQVEIPNCQALGWMVNGTPSDCIKLGLEALLDFTPDLVLSGINRGPNLGTDVIYSGTVSAAIEAALSGVPSLAFSITGKNANNFKDAAIYAKKICLQVIDNIFPNNTLLNVNIPSITSKDIRGVAITHLGTIRYRNSFDRRIDPRGRVYYWLAGESIENSNDVGSDVWAIKNNYISITPLFFDMTKYDVIDTIKKWNIEVD